MQETLLSLQKIEEQTKKLLGLNSIYELAFVNELVSFYHDYVFYKQSDLPSELKAKYMRLYNALGEKRLIGMYINMLYKYDASLELNYDTVMMLLNDIHNRL